MRLSELFEAKVLSSGLDGPLMDKDTIRVYHGTNDANFIISAVNHGVSGSMKVSRNYSYETNNNPLGLFVSPEITIARRFGDYILEFHTRVADLTSPVWPHGGSYPVTGEYSSQFDSDEDRKSEQLKSREYWSQHGDESIKNSDRPELAAMLSLSGERQALFNGDLNSNSIRAIWVDMNDGKGLTRLTRSNFIRLLSSGKLFGGRKEIDSSSDYNKLSDKLVAPRDSVSGDEFIDILLTRFPHQNREKLIGVILKNPKSIMRFLWNESQYKNIISDIKRL